MELGNKFRMYCCSIVALGLPIRNQTPSVHHQNDIFLSVHDDRFPFSGKIPMLDADI
jgi:hypothetical protein